ncbi:MAG TPA: DNA-processing protein DprA [Planctomycetota bacterium]|nr:DNA-processing protein DprA [Planctomycetota bacterium]
MPPPGPPACRPEPWRTGEPPDFAGPWAEAALRAALVPALTPRRWRRFVDRRGDPAAFARGDAAEIGRALGIGPGEARALGRDLERADPWREAERAAAAEIAILPWGSPPYPAPLTHLADPPPVLFARGALLPCDARAIAVIGSRRATPYGLRVARAIAGDLARAGVTVVSGLALGIDAVAHGAALLAGGRTVAVLGSGLLNPYPTDHLGLLEEIAATGAVLSEFPLRAAPLRRHFPQRNRLIAALSLGTLVVEASPTSGALGTVRHALDLGRAVMAVPGPVDEACSLGTLRLLQEGAAAVGAATDVFAALGWCAHAPSSLPDAERRVLEALGQGGATPLEAAAALGITEEAAAGHLVTLEIRGLVAREEGGRYMIP